MFKTKYKEKDNGLDTMKDLKTIINELFNESLSKAEESELIEYTRNIISQIISETDLDIEIKELWFHGSRSRDNYRDDSDYDIVLYYKGNEKEDSVFNIMHDEDYEDDLMWDGNPIDINPIRDEETGSLDEYKERDKKYKK